MYFENLFSPTNFFFKFSNRHQELKIDVLPVIQCELANKKKTVQARHRDVVPEFEWETKNDMLIHCIIVT